ncbi:serine/threonine-protein kinase ypk [Tritrichomonas foetus]|uniref:Serine/threonine-protein kinase ypk n=1 Tax=Tritrichomonas foetus TaxID=1144522 RepID=A0A1J4JEC7_9EUKA|nr:serine/threonine-protein kinase ypk [Tritrichomonas foetus]|eukprot:OHS96647.1 serine/threonine-protein kinase ypk [Tritrichomonas foetus]
MFGTTEYMSPEMINKENYGIEIDFWALGILMFEMLTETTPFYSSNKVKMMTAITRFAPNLEMISDPVARDLIKGLLIKNPKKRFNFNDIKKHPFFDEYDWDKIERLEYQPLFVPECPEINQPNNFDPRFTDELPVDSFIQTVCDDFPGFSFTADAFSNQFLSDDEKGVFKIES